MFYYSLDYRLCIIHSKVIADEIKIQTVHGKPVIKTG